MKITFDMSSVIWTSLLVGKDEIDGYEAPHPIKADKKCWVNSAAHGYENAINMMCAVLHAWRCAPIDCLLVFEGMQSKKGRMMIDKEYKAGRDKDRPVEAYTEFEKVREKLKATWKALGACGVSQPYVEGDDVIAWLAQETEEDMVIATRDRDLTILNQTNRHGAKVQVQCGDHKIGDNPYGPWDLRLLPLYKALVGDDSDNIKGVVGFGEKSFIAFLSQYGEDGGMELQELLELGSLDALHPQADECKLIKKICEQEANALKSYRCGRLYPEWVNTLKHPVEFDPGMVSIDPQPDERLERWAGQAYLVTADNFKEMWNFAQFHLDQSPELILDIETSTPPESDEWLAAQGDPDGVDQLGSFLVGLGLTFGRNNHITMYFSVDHADTDNIENKQVAQFIVDAAKRGKPLVIQNTMFELTVLYNEWADQMLAQFPEFHGFLPNVLDTKFEASYVNENEKTGLKGRSLMHLGYKQQSYDETTLLTGPVGTLPRGGRRVGDVFDVPGDIIDGQQQFTRSERRRYKMDELTAEHVFGYGIDDTRCTAALHNYYRLVMQLEHTWDVYLDVEIKAAYQHAKNFIDGTPVSIERSNELMREDDAKADKAWATVRQYLIEQGFEGTVCPEVDPDGGPLELADIKEIFSICAPRNFNGYQDVDEDGEPCPRKIRRPDGKAVGNMSLEKVLVHIKAVEEEPTLALLLEPLIKPGFKREDVKRLNDYIASRFSGEPDNPVGSPKKMAKLMYEVMALPIKVRNKATDAMRAKGIFDGNPKTDVLAIEYALRDGEPQQAEVLKAIKIMQMVRTRHSLYYDKYPLYVHWKTGRIHSEHNQCQANTRRASESKVNKQQLPKHQKIEGEPPRYREVIVPHKRNAVVVSLDFESQELVILAQKSKDPNLISIFVPPPGESKKSQHTITGLGIFQKLKAEYKNTTYAEFEVILEDKAHAWYADAKVARALGKKLNFTAEYGAMAAKVKDTLLLDTEDEAQDYLDAREAQFPLVAKWKKGVIEFVKKHGYVLTMEGAVRHLRDAIVGPDAWDAMKAERQAINMEIQGSAAEQTKKAEGRMWDAGLSFKYDAICYGPIHDEVVWSVAIEDLPAFLPELHACMVAPYGGIDVVPIGSSISFGPDFYNQIEIGNEPTQEAIAGGLEKLAEMMDERMAA